MSEIARWSYQSVAKVKPFLSRDSWTNESQYGEPYEVLCNFIAESVQSRSDDGAEFVSRHTIYLEDERPKFLDLILLEGLTEYEEIRAKTKWDMKMFEDVPDYKLVT